MINFYLNNLFLKNSINHYKYNKYNKKSMNNYIIIYLDFEFNKFK